MNQTALLAAVLSALAGSVVGLIAGSAVVWKVFLLSHELNQRREAVDQSSIERAERRRDEAIAEAARLGGVVMPGPTRPPTNVPYYVDGDRVRFGDGRTTDRSGNQIREGEEQS